MNVLVTGATGFVGQTLVRRLVLHEGHDVRMRSQAARRETRCQRVERGGDRRQCTASKARHRPQRPKAIGG